MKGYLEYIINKLADSNELLAIECLDKIHQSDIHFHRGIFQNKSQLTSLYELRWKMAEELNRDKFKMEELENWKDAIEKLKTASFHEAQLSIIATEEKTYFIFINLDINQLAAIFFLYQKKSLDEREKYNQEIKQRGYTVSGQRYRKGILLDD